MKKCDLPLDQIRFIMGDTVNPIFGGCQMPGSWLVNGAPMGSPEDRPSNYGYIQQAHSYLEAVPCHRSRLLVVLSCWLSFCAGVAVVVAVVGGRLLVVAVVGCPLVN